MKSSESRSLVVVDPGHGGSDPGAVNPATGRRESDINLRLAEIFREVSAGAAFDIVSLRMTDTLVTLEDRVRLANQLDPEAFISFHCNAAENPDAHGFEVWTSPGQTDADGLATLLYTALDETLPTIGRQCLDDGDPDKEANFYVLRKTASPAVLIEFGFISNPDEEKWLADPKIQKLAATAVRVALDLWLP